MNIFPITGAGTSSTHLISNPSRPSMMVFISSHTVCDGHVATIHNFYLLSYCVINLLMFKP